MIARRVAAVILGIVTILAIWGSAALLRFNETALDDDFLIEQLRDADAFNFFYDVVMPQLLQEASEEETMDRAIDYTRIQPQVITAARGTLSPEWLQEQSEIAIHAFVPFLVGDESTFVIEVLVADRIRAGGEAAKVLINDDAFIDFLYEEFIEDQAKEIIEDQEVPFDIPITAEEIVERLRRMAPDEWVQEQVARAVDSVIPYFAGETDSFEILIPINERVPAARQQIEELLEKLDATSYIFREIVDPNVDLFVGAGVPVPFDLEVTSQDVRDVLREVLAGDWANQRVNEFAGAILDYASGVSESFVVDVPLTELKGRAVTQVGLLMDRKLEALYSGLPVCTPEQLRTIDFEAFIDTGIICRPSGMSLQDLEALAGVDDYTSEVAGLVDGALPDTFRFTEADLRSTFSNAQWDQIQDVRGWIKEGYSFTSADLEEVLAEADYPDDALVPFDELDEAGKQRALNESDNVDALRDARQEIREGGQFTDVDLMERMEEAYPGSWEDLKTFRRSIGRARGLWFLGWLVPALMLFAVGMVGGRSLPGKVIWAASFLVVASLVLYVSSGPAYESTYRGQIEESINENIEVNAEDDPYQRTVSEKGRDVLLNLADDVNSGMAHRSLIVLIISVAVVGGATLWHYRSPDRGSQDSS